jgi:single-stranded-DNA-specific exonuclease
MFNNNTLSVLGRQWKQEPINERDSLTLQQKHDLQPLLSEIILRRKINIQDAATYLEPTIKNTLQDPSLLKDMDKAVERVLKAIENKEKILIYADYDVDGATSSALIRKFFKEIGIETGLYIPDRIEEGYGANIDALQSIKDEKYDLVIMCDCGTTSFEPLAHAKKIGLDIIVLDHHTTEPNLPECVALINPHRLDQDEQVKNNFGLLCAAGVAFCFLAALNRVRQQQKQNVIPNLIDYLDLVALGTVCDVMPLKGINRAIVSQGLKLMQRQKNIGLSALMQVSGVYDAPSSYHLGFFLGPRINAGGRVGKADMGSKLLTATDPLTAKRLAEQLHHFNEERKTVEMIMLEQAYIKIEDEKLYKDPVIVVSGNDWHPGVIGIAASRIKEKYNKPTIVIAFDKEEGKGSGRSVPGVDLGPSMHDAVHKNILLKGGGHAMAVGLSIKKDRLDDFRTFLINRFAEDVQNYQPISKVDAVLSIAGVHIDLAKSLLQLEPFGQGNPTPKFMLENVRPCFVMPVGDGHFRITLEDKGGNKLEAMAFRVRGTPLEKALTNTQNNIHVLGSVKYDVWNNKEKASFFIDDVMVI